MWKAKSMASLALPIAAKPKCAAQRIRFFKSDAAAGTVTLRPEVGSQQQVEAAAGTYDVVVGIPGIDGYTTEFPVTHIVTASGGTISAIVMWWYGTGIDINK